MKLNCFETVELSDVGLKRKNNEDACLRVPERGVYCVADGMGGVVGGDLASAAIIDRMRKVFVEAPATETESFAGHVALFRQAADAASRWIKEFADDKVIGQMGSTLVALVFDPNNPRRAVGLHAGDSRLYRYRNGQLQLLTADHTAAAALAAKLGRDAAEIPGKFHNELVRAVGLAETVELEKTLVDVASGDLFLLCSDGLTRMLSEEAISAALKSTNGGPLDLVAQTLITGANEAGGKDNVTVILVRMGDLSGFSEVFEPADLDAPHNVAAHAGLEGEPVSLSSLGSGRGRDSTESMRGHTPQTADAGAVHGDTPNEDSSGQMRGDTPQTDDASGPPTPPTVRLVTPPGGVDGKKEVQVPEVKRVAGNGKLIGAVLVVLIAGAGAYFFYRSGSSSPKSNDGDQPQRTAPVSASAPANSLGVSTAPHPAPAKAESPPPFQTGGVLVQSDPSGADVWLGNQPKGKTPLHLTLLAGQANMTLKVIGLRDQAATTTVAPGKTNEMAVNFPYGNVIIRSEPAGAAVEQNGTVFGYTPYTGNRLAPGRFNWRLSANGWQATNVFTDVFDHQTTQTTVKLQREKGVLQLTGNLPGIMAKLDGVGVGQLPASFLVDPEVEHTVTAEYKGVEKTIRAVRVKGSQTNVVPFTFNVELPPLKWTNNFLGMVFVKVPSLGVWSAASRVTLEQFMKVMAGAPNAAKENEDNGQHYAVNLTSALTKNFAAKLTEVNGGGGRLDEIKGYHFALPTTNQWMQTFISADKLGIEMTSLKADREWCLDGSTWYMAGYVLLGTNFHPKPGYKPINPPPGDEPKQLAIRLVLVP
jgi:protein phosphatase